MKRKLQSSLWLVFCLILVQNSWARQEKKEPVDLVDPTIGGVGLILQPTRPAVHLPNSMIRVFPARTDQLDDQIQHFPLTISSHRQNWLFGLMPYQGPLDEKAWTRKFTSDQEKISPDFYEVLLEETGTKIAFSPQERSGFFRFYYEKPAQQFLRMSILNQGEISLENAHAFSGVENFRGMKAYFYAEVSQPLEKIHYQPGKEKKVALLELRGNAQTLYLRYGISFISIEQAKNNLKQEIQSWDLEGVRENARQKWNTALSRLQIKGGTEAQQRVFYTSLYRSYERMININEYGRYYSAYDQQVHASDRPFYVDNWLWDTYIALEPLHAIINPGMQSDKLHSYVQMYEQSGWMPSFALTFGDDPCMTGNHAAAWFLDSHVKGIAGFDMKKAYAGIRKNSLEATLLPWRNGPATSLDSFYHEKGYLPALKPGEKETVKEVHAFEKRQSVAVTLENSYDDWCLAQLARYSGEEQDRPLFMQKAANYKNVFRADKGFVWPKDAEGNWIEPFDPKFSGGQGGREYFTENNAYTYNWNVKHDLEGLFELMGGQQAAEEKLDDLFRASLGRSKYQLWATFPDATGLVGQFVMGNEPAFHIPYLYNYLGAPYKTQKRIRMLMDTWFTDHLFGIPGDEDGGGMTAFVVFSMMGFFPVTPGIPVYSIGSPVFEETQIQLPDGKIFRVKAINNSHVNKYIQAAELNGKRLERSWFTHEELLQGGELRLTMGESPQKEWGKSELPPSSLNYKP